jgi:DNA-binding CsgD family transcriptional regulator/flagellar basal body-associated protein FliL
MLENLTHREREIFDLLLEGVSPKEIAHKHNISYNTVDFHRKNLYNKLGIHNIQELFAKYSTNGKAPPSEAMETKKTAPASAAKKKKKKLKILLPAGIILLVFSVLFLLIFIRKSSTHSTPKGEIIPVNNLGFYATSDVGHGGNSTSEVYITQEKIDGVKVKSVLNIKTNLVKEENRDDYYANARTEYLNQRLRKANGIRFKALGDGKVWAIEFQTKESTPERNYACYTYMLGTTHDQVVVVDIPYSSLFLPEWWEQFSFDFNKENIKSLSIAANAIQGYGSSFLQIFDFEIY